MELANKLDATIIFRINRNAEIFIRSSYVGKERRRKKDFAARRGCIDGPKIGACCAVCRVAAGLQDLIICQVNGSWLDTVHSELELETLLKAARCINIFGGSARCCNRGECTNVCR